MFNKMKTVRCHSSIREVCCFNQGSSKTRVDRHIDYWVQELEGISIKDDTDIDP